MLTHDGPCSLYSWLIGGMLVWPGRLVDEEEVTKVEVKHQGQASFNLMAYYVPRARSSQVLLMGHLIHNKLSGARLHRLPFDLKKSLYNKVYQEYFGAN